MAFDFETQFGIGKDMVVVELGKVLGIVVGMFLVIWWVWFLVIWWVWLLAL